MNYELAKELKGVGFPSSDKWGFIENENQSMRAWGSPTLQGLIEACGLQFSLLESDMDGWFAYANKNGVSLKTKGETPSEAVGKLWVALNKP